jgi:hypothetical protein
MFCLGAFTIQYFHNSFISPSYFDGRLLFNNEFMSMIQTHVEICTVAWD